MAYKTGEEPQINDEVLGQKDGQAVRGRVVAVMEGKVRLTRRAPYAGAGKPLASIHEDVDQAALSLVFRPLRPAPGMPTPAPQGKKKAAAAAPKKEAAAK